MSLTRRGPNANAPAKLPALQAVRLSDPRAQAAIEALREWVEVRLGSRGDKFEKAVTLRELEQLLEPIERRLDGLRLFDGTLGSLTATSLSGLPSGNVAGRFALVEGELFFDNGTEWQKVTLGPA